jgi:ATP-dependent DNA helicase RecG
MNTHALPSNVLATSVRFLKGIGPRKSALLEQHGISTLQDLFFHVPRRYLDRSVTVTVEELRTLSRRQPVGDQPLANVRRDYTVVGEVRSFTVVGFRAKARFVLVLADKSGSMQCVWFGGVSYWKTRFTIGETLAVSGQPTYFGNVLQFVHPDIDRIAGAPDEEEADGKDAEAPEVDWGNMLNTGGMVPVYPSSKELERIGLDSSGFRRLLASAIRQQLDAVRETLPGHIIRKRQLVPLGEALRTVHFPQVAEKLEESLRRLKYEELFYFQLKLALKRHRVKHETQGIAFNVQSRLARQLLDSLPFALTRAQARAVREITADMSQPRPLNRLLQGDVGSGKTIVALLCMLIAVENGRQAVFMAPTEILAEQHFKTLAALLQSLPVNVRLLIGGQRSRLRRDVLDDVQRGSAHIVVGTHALFEKEVEFANLGFVVIDEQHRFGVLQRASLRKKGVNPDVLVMTATPIPRTLSLTLYGDLDVSIIDELPRDRKPIKTVLRNDREKDDVFRFVREQIHQGRQAYFVYPLIEESEKVDLKAATVHFEHLQRDVFPDLRLGLLHGRLPTGDKDAVMMKFKNRELDILVATTVIEVGIDVPNASVMVIENAERFGLSQLHQLRGRVGRGSDQSYCVLLTEAWIARKAKGMKGFPGQETVMEQQRQAEQRLSTMVSTTDGFKIAEVDLQLRGPGDFFGTRQSGIPEFRVANILVDTSILSDARDDAFTLVAHDPQLRLPEHGIIIDHLRGRFRDALALVRVG